MFNPFLLPHNVSVITCLFSSHSTPYFQYLFLANSQQLDVPGTMAAQQSPSKGHQAALCSRGELLRRSSAGSVVQRLALREVSGQRLGLRVHQHYGFRMCYEWRGTFGTRSFSRRFRSYDAVVDFCISIVMSPLQGMANCIFTRAEFGAIRTEALLELLHDRTEVCRAIFVDTRPPDINEPWYPLRAEREWQEGVRVSLRRSEMYTPGRVLRDE
jgi:hypothetical protein